MKLEEIGFYTLSDERAKNTSISSPLWRGEMLVTDKCNFNCSYCRPLKFGEMDLDYAFRVLDCMIEHGLKNVRFSGGEPWLYSGDLGSLILHSYHGGVERIAISTNGSAPFWVYRYYIDCGVNDFSISLDACCASEGSRMNGGNEESWERSVENIKRLSELTYVTVGVVFTEETVEKVNDVLKFASSLGVDDIRIISSAQYNVGLGNLRCNREFVEGIKYPILKYRLNNYYKGKNVRGIHLGDSDKCYLVLDDLAVAGDYHFPCIIYLREGGKPIGYMSPKFREERLEWLKKHSSLRDPICLNNCLDVCVDYNNRVANFKEGIYDNQG